MKNEEGDRLKTDDNSVDNEQNEKIDDNGDDEQNGEINGNEGGRGITV